MRRLAATLAVAFGVLLVPATASALTFEVDTLESEGNASTACVEAPFECSLRDAIERANETTGLDVIDFSKLFAGTIELDEPLPPVIWPVEIDATTAADYSDAGHPVIALDGSGVNGTETKGIEILETAGGSTVEGLAIGGFYLGIFAYSEAPSDICGNYIGVLPDGETALPNTYAGISTGGSGALGKGIRIGAGCAAGNLISGNGQFGILEAGEETEIEGNRIGVDANDAPLANGNELQVSSGIEVNAQAIAPVIGGTAPGEGNVIADNGGPGVRVQKNASNVSVRGNSIYANEDAGIEFSEGDPALSTFVEAFAGNTWFGWLKGLASNAEFEVDFFTNEKCDGSGKGEGQFYLGSDAVETDAGGEVEWAIDVGSQLSGIDAEAFTATVTDKATGQTSQFSECARTRPDTSILTTPPSLTTATSATFTFSGSDLGHVDRFECSLDGGPASVCSTPYELTGVADGVHVFRVTAYDGENFFTFPVPSYEWTVDGTAPQSSIQSGPPAETTSGDASFAFSGSDPVSGIERLECSLDGGAFETCSSPRQVSGLGPGPHSFAVRGVDKAGNVQSAPASYQWQVSAPSQQPEPENGESVAVAPAGGKVFVTRPGQGKTELKEGETIPVGSVVDATKGKVTLTSVNKAGETQTAIFYGGKFLIAEQERNGLVVLKLRGVLRCGKARPSLATASAGRKGRRLWGSGKGKFRTEGNYASATVRGTVWLTEDRCGGTFVKVRKGVVSVRDFPAGQTISVPAGKSYLAKSP